MKDFFISYNKADIRWAEWIAWTLEMEGYTTVIQAWDFRPGNNFVQSMQRAATNTAKTIAVLSDHYMSAEYTMPEWADAFARDPKGEKRILIPVRVSPCNPKGLLAQVIYTNLVGLNEEDAKIAILGDLNERGKPMQAPSYPGSALNTNVSAAANKPKPFPEKPKVSPLQAWEEKLEFLQVQEAEISDHSQQFTLKKRIEEAKRKIEEYSTNPIRARRIVTH